MKPRGRPRTDSIPRFNVDTHLTSNRKFIRFRRSLKLDDRTAWITLARFFNYVAANCAMNPIINAEDHEAIADFCWWDGEPEALIAALYGIGIIDPDHAVHDHYVHQPLAALIRRDRDLKSARRQEPAEPRSAEARDGTHEFSPIIAPLNRENYDQPITHNYEPTTYNPEPTIQKEETPIGVSRNAPGKSNLCETVLRDWNQLAKEIPRIPEIKILSRQRRRHIKARFQQSEWDWDGIRRGIRASSFLRGDSGKWVITFDWLFKCENNWPKILEGNYASKIPTDDLSIYDA